MPTFRLNKLVRDKLPDVYDELGQQVRARRLIGRELLVALRSKLIEETAETPVDGEDRQAIVEELGDAAQARKDLQVVLGISDEEIEAARQRKFERKGGFSEGIFVETIMLDDDDKWVEYYRSEPDKYEEIHDD